MTGKLGPLTCLGHTNNRNKSSQRPGQRLRLCAGQPTSQPASQPASQAAPPTCTQLSQNGWLEWGFLRRRLQMNPSARPKRDHSLFFSLSFINYLFACGCIRIRQCSTVIGISKKIHHQAHAPFNSAIDTIDTRTATPVASTQRPIIPTSDTPTRSPIEPLISTFPDPAINMSSQPLLQTAQGKSSSVPGT